MEVYNTQNETRVKDLRLKRILEFVADMRTDERGDVTLICHGKEFRAYKWLLEYSSPYFVRMFRSGMEEASSGKVKFECIEPDTLEAILNYVYLGEVKAINTDERVKDVLAAAHMMEVKGLVDYCFDALSCSLSKENCLEYWEISFLYDNHAFQIRILEYVVTNFSQLKGKCEFLELSNARLKQLLNFASLKEERSDELLLGLLDWLRHDLKEREPMTEELFACIEPKYLGHDSLKSLLRDRSLMAASSEIANKMNALGVDVFVLGLNGSRSEGIIRFVLDGLDGMRIDVRSPPRVIHNLPWNILVRPYNTTGGERTIGFYTECNRGSKEKDWSCNAALEYRLLRHNEHSRPIIRKTKHMFSSDVFSWGFADYVYWEDISNPLTSYIPGANDKVIFEVHVIASATFE